MKNGMSVFKDIEQISIPLGKLVSDLGKVKGS